MHHLWLAVVCLVLAVVFIAVEHEEHYLAADVIKGCASLCFVVLGLLGYLEAPANVSQAYRGLILAGLAVGALADVVLNLRYCFEGKKGQIAFLAGILVFLCGHVLYLLALLQVCMMPYIFVGIGLVLTGILMAWIFRNIDAGPAFKLFGIFYIGAITVMNCVAFGALITRFSMHSFMFCCGALLFFVSDLILILNTFGPEQRFTWRCANLMLYYVGQLFIALSLQAL